MGWWLNAKPGDRVVCISNCHSVSTARASWLFGKGMTLPQRGSVYSIRCIGPTVGDPKRFSLRLREIVNPPLIVEGVHIGEVCWAADAFRPVVHRATDISVFTAMLTGSPAKADA